MPIDRLLSGRNFAPDSLQLIARLFALALERLHIGADDEAAKLKLAKLILDIAAPKLKLCEDDLLDKIEVAWGWRYPSPGVRLRK
jgi:hypothetical protein